MDAVDDGFGIGRPAGPLDDIGDAPLWIHQEGDAVDDPKRRQNAVRFGGFALDVGQQRKVQAVFLREALVGFDRVGADAKHGDIERFEGRHLISETARFLSAQHRSVLRVKIDHEPATLVVDQAVDFPALIHEPEFGSGIAFGETRSEEGF